jgi:SAM-dependent methyltransferase
MQMPSPKQFLKNIGRWLRAPQDSAGEGVIDVGVGEALYRAESEVPGQDLTYQERLAREVKNYRTVENVHDLPEIFHYWSNKYLLPKFQQFGFNSPRDFFRVYMSQVCRENGGKPLCFISVGAGNCDTEIEITESLRAEGLGNFVLECLDINPHMLDRGRKMAQQKQIAEAVRFTQADINSWHPKQQYQVIMANQSLHHFVELEVLFDKVYDVLTPDGLFLSDDMIGRNGHMRWPEALALVNRLWKELPEKYRYNHQLKRLEVEFDNWDCSKEGFEGIRAQDVLPLLITKFNFELFVGFGNLIDVFIDRSFGHNFDPKNPADLGFIDKVHFMDEDHIERGVIKPAHMTAVMVKQKVAKTKTHKHLTPEFCVRWPDSPK